MKNLHHQIFTTASDNVLYGGRACLLVACAPHYDFTHTRGPCPSPSFHLTRVSRQLLE